MSSWFPCDYKSLLCLKNLTVWTLKGCYYVHFQHRILFWGSTGETFHDSQLKNKCAFHFLLAIYAESQYMFWLKQSQLLSL